MMESLYSGGVMSGWGCPHVDKDGACTKVAGRPCDPGMKGCVLAGRFRFTNPTKNRPAKPDAGVNSSAIRRIDVKSSE